MFETPVANRIHFRQTQQSQLGISWDCRRETSVQFSRRPDIHFRQAEEEWGLEIGFALRRSGDPFIAIVL